MGNDGCRDDQPVLTISSIHVPAWGTTAPAAAAVTFALFQSTFPHGGRYRGYIHFNPRSRMGNDGLLFSFLQTSPISIHVPAWGTTIYDANTETIFLFQSTFPHGERLQSFSFPNGY